jgi:hypothetical protein
MKNLITTKYRYLIVLITKFDKIQFNKFFSGYKSCQFISIICRRFGKLQKQSSLKYVAMIILYDTKHRSLPQHIDVYVTVCTYEGVSKSFRTGRLERELQTVQLSATRCSCIAILWISLVSFVATTFVLLLNGCLLVCSSFLGSTAQLRPWPPPQNPTEFVYYCYCCLFRYRLSPETLDTPS